VAGAQENRRLRVIVAELTPLSLEGGVLRVRPGLNMAVAAQALRGELAVLASQVNGASVEIVIEAASAPSTPALEDNGLSLESATQHPLIKQAVELFGARVVRVQPRKAPGEQ